MSIPSAASDHVPVLEACAAQNKAGDLLPQYAVRPSPDLTSPALSEHISMPSYDLTGIHALALWMLQPNRLGIWYCQAVWIPPGGLWQAASPSSGLFAWAAPKSEATGETVGRLGLAARVELGPVIVVNVKN
ncbi:hypothetical protein CNMCM5793_002121 [Aspergillus hiratsukae]|uniref:Uncharacterized protein n=1 Tax=Aspergillus hiratsukae TaxID=1194566 RepID=A0A8H6Q9S6_9EURO|nr:hypothetical protein CNMCM5793_002121 [Aspergillus hiratsukae]KAF7168459.1 hypothetical protein CNMCM6106_003647 [Aspergillus hiratsukae]